MPTSTPVLAVSENQNSSRTFHFQLMDLTPTPLLDPSICLLFFTTKAVSEFSKERTFWNKNNEAQFKAIRGAKNSFFKREVTSQTLSIMFPYRYEGRKILPLTTPHQSSHRWRILSLLNSSSHRKAYIFEGVTVGQVNMRSKMLLIKFSPSSLV